MPTDANSELAGKPTLRSTHSLSTAPLPWPAPTELAVFLDLDGTLAPIARTPDEAHIPAVTLRLLDDLYRSGAGALAIVSGRDTPDIDRLLGPLLLPYAALHGATIRSPNGLVESVTVPQEGLAEISRSVANQMQNLPGTILERKALSVALHYRNAPQFENEVRQIASSALLDHGADFEIQEGKMVVEIKPRGANKASAIERFMGIAPFQGRTPLFAGDDLTDEPAFRLVNAMGGLSIKVGPGETQARWRLDDPPALSAWLTSLLSGHVPDSDSIYIDGGRSNE